MSDPAQNNSSAPLPQDPLHRATGDSSTTQDHGGSALHSNESLARSNANPIQAPSSSSTFHEARATSSNDKKPISFEAEAQLFRTMESETHLFDRSQFPNVGDIFFSIGESRVVDPAPRRSSSTRGAVARKNKDDDDDDKLQKGDNKLPDEMRDLENVVVIKVFKNNKDYCKRHPYYCELMHNFLLIQTGHTCAYIVRLLGRAELKNPEEEGALLKGIVLEKGKPLTPKVFKNNFSQSRKILLHIAEALKFLHENGFVHCDVKIENILLFELGVEFIAKLCDLGSMKRINVSVTDPDNKTCTKSDVTSTIVEKSDVTSPIVEKSDVTSTSVAGSAEADLLLQGKPIFARPTLDIYCFGKTLIKPLEETAPGALAAALRDLRERCTAHNPDDRPQNGAALVQELESILKLPPSTAAAAATAGSAAATTTTVTVVTAE